MNKSEKVKKSEEQRLQSLKEKAEEYKTKKNLIRDSTLNQNNCKKFFSDSENEEDETPKQQLQKKNKKTNKSLNLFDGASDEDEGLQMAKKKTVVLSKKKTKKSLNSTDDEDEDEIDDVGDDSFDKNVNLSEDKQNKLIYLKTKFSSDDRFKFDERFIDSDSDKEEEKDEIEQEKESALKILEQITGKPIKKLHEKSAAQNSDSRKKMSNMVRYDPTKEEHKMFELSKENEIEEEKLKAARKSSAKKNEEEEVEKDDEDNEHTVTEQNAGQYYEIRDDIKNLFCKNEVFQFKFSKNQEKSSDEELEDNKDESGDETAANNKFKNFAQMKRSLDYLDIKSNNKYESSISSEGDDDDVIHGAQEENVAIRQSETNYKTKEKDNKFLKRDFNIQHEKKADLIPNLDDSRLQEALAFFKRPKEIDELREEWTKEREKLVEDYKKKHKRAKRVQRVKDEEKLFFWKKSAFEQKKFKKQKK